MKKQSKKYAINQNFTAFKTLLDRVTHLPLPDNIGCKNSQGIMRLKKLNGQNLLRFGCNKNYYFTEMIKMASIFNRKDEIKIILCLKTKLLNSYRKLQLNKLLKFFYVANNQQKTNINFADHQTFEDTKSRNEAFSNESNKRMSAYYGELLYKAY